MNRDRQNQGKDEQRQTETVREEQRQTETVKYRQRQTETVEDEQRQIRPEKRRVHSIEPLFSPSSHLLHFETKSSRYSSFYFFCFFLSLKKSSPRGTTNAAERQQKASTKETAREWRKIQQLQKIKSEVFQG